MHARPGATGSSSLLHLRVRYGCGAGAYQGGARCSGKTDGREEARLAPAFLGDVRVMPSTPQPGAVLTSRRTRAAVMLAIQTCKTAIVNQSWTAGSPACIHGESSLLHATPGRRQRGRMVEGTTNRAGSSG